MDTWPGHRVFFLLQLPNHAWAWCLCWRLKLSLKNVLTLVTEFNHYFQTQTRGRKFCPERVTNSNRLQIAVMMYPQYTTWNQLINHFLDFWRENLWMWVFFSCSWLTNVWKKRTFFDGSLRYAKDTLPNPIWPFHNSSEAHKYFMYEWECELEYRYINVNMFTGIS